MSVLILILLLPSLLYYISCCNHDCYSVVSSSAGHPTCYYCGKRGHYQTMCPNRLRQEVQEQVLNNASVILIVVFYCTAPCWQGICCHPVFSCHKSGVLVAKCRIMEITLHGGARNMRVIS